MCALLIERGTRDGALKGWATRRRSFPKLGTPRRARSLAKRRLGFAYTKIKRGGRARVATALFTNTGRTVSEPKLHKSLIAGGLLKGAKMGLGVGLKTGSGVVKFTLKSNDNRHIYTGSTLGMRQKLMSWHKQLGETLPRGFENYGPADVEKLFMEWNTKDRRGDTRFDKLLRRYTNPAKPVGGNE